MQNMHVRRWLFSRNQPGGSDLVIGLSNNPSLTGFHFSSCPSSSPSYSFSPSSPNSTSASSKDHFPDIGDLNTVLSCVDGVLLGISYGFKGLHPIIPLIHSVTGDSRFADARSIVRRTAYTQIEVNNFSCFARLELCWLFSGILLVITCFEAVDGGPVLDDVQIRVIMPQQVRELVSAYDTFEDSDEYHNSASVRANYEGESSIQGLKVPEWTFQFEIKEQQGFGTRDIRNTVFEQSVRRRTNKIEYEPEKEAEAQMMHRTEDALQLRNIDEQYASREDLPHAFTKDHPPSFPLQPRIDNNGKTGIDEVEMSRYVCYTKWNRSSYPTTHKDFNRSYNELVANVHMSTINKNGHDQDDDSNNKTSETTIGLWAHFQEINRKSRQHGTFRTKLTARESNLILTEKEVNYVFLCSCHGFSIDSRIKQLITHLGLHFSEPETDRLLFSLKNEGRKLHGQEIIYQQKDGESTVVPHLPVPPATLQLYSLSAHDSVCQDNSSPSHNTDGNRNIILNRYDDSSPLSQNQTNMRAIPSSFASNTDHISSVPVLQFTTPSIPISRRTPFKLNKRPTFTPSSTHRQNPQLTFHTDNDAPQNPNESDLEGATRVDPFQAASMGRRLCDDQGHESWECIQCGATIRGKRGNLKRHVLLKHFNLRPFVCNADGCGRRFQNRVNLTRHIINVHQGRPFSCPRCPRTFKLESQMATHIERAHVDALADSTGRGEARCDRCKRCFDLVSTLNRHRRTVHGIYDQNAMIGLPRTQVITNTDRPELPTEGEEKSDHGNE